jgi:hypothetical protein
MGRGREVRLQAESTRGHNLRLGFCWNWHRDDPPVLFLFCNRAALNRNPESDGSKL